MSLERKNPSSQSNGNAFNQNGRGRAAGRTDAVYQEQSPAVKGNMVTAVILFVLYAGLAVVGSLMAFTDVLNGVISSIQLGDYTKTIGLLWLTTVPSFGYYFATITPFKMPKPLKVIIFVLSLLLTIVADVLYFIFAEKLGCTAVWDDEDKITMPLMVIVGSVGLLLCYVLPLLNVNVDGMGGNNQEASDDDGIFGVVKKLITGIAGLFIGLGKFILNAKEKHPNVFIVVAVLLLTYFNFFTTIFVLFILGAIIFSLLALVCAGMLGVAASMPDTHDRYQIEDDYGNTRTLTYSAYERGHEVYRDEDGEEWLTDDNGQTFYQLK